VPTHDGPWPVYPQAPRGQVGGRATGSVLRCGRGPRRRRPAVRPVGRAGAGDAAALLDGYDGRWWVAGGWAIEAVMGPRREHGDLDVGLPRPDVGRLWRHLAGRLDVWAADESALRPLLSPDDDVPPSCVNLWLRRSGADPWDFDVLPSDVQDGIWRFRRDRRISRPLGRGAGRTRRHSSPAARGAAAAQCARPATGRPGRPRRVLAAPVRRGPHPVARRVRLRGPWAARTPEAVLG